MAIRLQKRDFEIFTHMSRFGFVTVNQLCALVEPNGKGPSADLRIYRNGMYIRLSLLQREGYISSGPAPTWGEAIRSAYFLSPSGARILSDLREYENLSVPRWLEKRRHFVWTQGPHDLIACNMTANLVALARITNSFSIEDYIGGRDCRYYIPDGETSSIFNPDLYYVYTAEGAEPIPMFPVCQHE